jgi:hypothetical protein
VTTRRRLAVCLPICGLLALTAAGTGLGAAETSQSAGDDGPSIVFGLVLGGLVAAIVMLVLAVLPVTAVPRLPGLRGDRRLDLALAGAIALLVVTIIYLSAS